MKDKLKPSPLKKWIVVGGEIFRVGRGGFYPDKSKGYVYIEGAGPSQNALVKEYNMLVACLEALHPAAAQEEGEDWGKLLGDLLDDCPVHEDTPVRFHKLKSDLWALIGRMDRSSPRGGHE